MIHQFVRVALRLYPPAWRERYGSELEQLILDVAPRDRSVLGSVRLIADVARGGVSQRVARHRRAVRGALMVSLCAGVVFPLDVVTLNAPANEATGAPVLPSARVVLSSSTKLAPGVVLLRVPASVAPLQRSAQPPVVELETIAHSDDVVSVDGPPAAVVLNPRTGQLVSVTPIEPR